MLGIASLVKRFADASLYPSNVTTYPPSWVAKQTKLASIDSILSVLIATGMMIIPESVKRSARSHGSCPRLGTPSVIKITILYT